MCRRIKHPKPILIGVSFGGILVQEMAGFLDYEKVIIVSSIKSNKELPTHMKLAKITNAHKLLPTQWIKNIETFTRTMGENWILRVHCDNMYFTGVKPKVINLVARSDSEVSNTEEGIDFDNLTTDIATRLRSNESVFESTRNISINDKLETADDKKSAGEILNLVKINNEK